MSLKLTNNIININKPVLTIKELLNTINYEYNTIFLDKFWQSINDDMWIYIDDNMLKYIGYMRSEYKKNKHDYLNILKENFEIEIDYKVLFLKEFGEFSKCQKLALENVIINEHNKVKHLIVSPDCFKQSLMLLKTAKSKEIKKYYIELEKVFKFYLEYQNEYRKKELENKDNIINELKNDNILKSNFCFQNLKLNREEYIYIASTNKYMNSNIYKIGKTINFQTRIHTYQTGRFGDDKYHYLYIFKCHNSSILEQYILNKLKIFRYIDKDSKIHKELFQIDYNILLNLIKRTEEFENYIISKLNISFDNHMNNIYTDNKPEIITDIVEFLNKKENEYCNKYNYDNPDYINSENIKTNYNIYCNEPNRSKLTNEDIEDKLNNKYRLLSQYNGNCDEELEFECKSIFKHKFKMSYLHALRKIDRGCYYCTKHGILDKINIYEYDINFNYIKTYNGFDELKTVNLNYQLLKNIIREQRWLTSNNKKIYSILEPDNNKLNINKELNKYEILILNILDISIDNIILKYQSTESNIIYAIDNENYKIYTADNYTLFSKKLYYHNSTVKKINRKTIIKYINTDKIYGGYLWYNNKSNIDLEKYQIINLMNL